MSSLLPIMEAPPPPTVQLGPPNSQGWASTPQPCGQCLRDCVWNECELCRQAGREAELPLQAPFFLLYDCPPPPTPDTSQSSHPCLSSQDPSHHHQLSPLPQRSTHLLPSLPTEHWLRQGHLQPMQEPCHQPVGGREQPCPGGKVRPESDSASICPQRQRASLPEGRLGLGLPRKITVPLPGLPG